MTYVKSSQVVGDVVTLSEAKEFMLVDGSGDDNLIQSLIKAAVKTAERAMNRDILETTWINYRDSFYAQDLTLRRGAFSSLETIEYLIDGSYATLATTEYKTTIGGSFGVICEIDPPSTDLDCNSVKITFKTGFGDDEACVPEDIKVAIKNDVNFLFTNRSDCGCDGSSCGFSPIAKMIYRNYKIIDLVGSGTLHAV